MKILDSADLDKVGGRRLGADEPFCFSCHPGLGCFTKCCRNINLFLRPYDVLRLRKRLGLDSGEFIDRHASVVLREQNHFPEVLLDMADNEERTCPFLSDRGCTVYEDRPETCRSFPVEPGLLFGEDGKARPVYFYRPPDFCEGRHEPDEWTPRTYVENQGAVHYHRMNARWGELRALFARDPWGPEGPEGPRARMAFMAAYNLDEFRRFVLESSFAKRFGVRPALLKKVRRDDEELLLLGFDWIRAFVFGLPAKRIGGRR